MDEPLTKKPFSIHPDTRIGTLALLVADLDAQLHFYRSALNLQIHWQTEDQAGLGAGGADLLQLTEKPGNQRYRRVTGLYHLALLYPDRAGLARAIARLISLRYPNAPTDHIMTKSTYLEDPEGNGIELYAESPEDGSWSMEGGTFGAVRADGTWSDGREPLDLEALFQHLAPAEPLDRPAPPALRIGHVHLHVRNLDEALDFYHGLLGFDIMGLARQVGAAFVSAGGYHHHIGLNTWQGEGAPPPPEDALGLEYFTILLPDQDAVDAITARIQAKGMEYERDGGSIRLKDPFSHAIRLMSRSIGHEAGRRTSSGASEVTSRRP
jgi:catechol 2,3-dioxygenase